MVEEKIAEIFLDKEDMRQDEYEIYMFGINQIISFVINVFTIMVLGFIFLAVFISMGIMAGLIILIMSPVDTVNKTLDIIEISCYRRFTAFKIMLCHIR